MKKRCIGLVLAAALACTPFYSAVSDRTCDTAVVHSASVYHISENGIAMIKDFEGFTQYAQWDYAQWSIGYGTGVDRDAYPNGITEAEADRLLREVVLVFEKYVNNFLNKYSISVTQNQYDALVSFTYNMGNVWSNSSEVTIRTYLINGITNYTPEEITAAFRLWCKAGGQVLPGLLRRRQVEAELFLSDMDYSKNQNGEKWRITSTTGVRLRSGSSTTTQVLNVIPYNQTFYVDEKKECEGFLWGKTTYSGQNGWCVLDYADYISGEVETTVIPDDEKYEQYSINSTSGVNLRYNYGMDNKVLAVIPYETVITVYEKKKLDDYLWGRTEYNGKAGWCVLNYAKRFGAEETPESLSIEKLPKKTLYEAGELFDCRGMIVVAHYSDGRDEITEDYGCTGNTMLPGTSTITVEYRGASTSFSVLVNARRGDVNKNGVIDLDDDAEVRGYILNNSGGSVPESGDINGDGVINIFDSMRIRNEVLYREK